MVSSVTVDPLVTVTKLELWPAGGYTGWEKKYTEWENLVLAYYFNLCGRGRMKGGERLVREW